MRERAWKTTESYHNRELLSFYFPFIFSILCLPVKAKAAFIQAEKLALRTDHQHSSWGLFVNTKLCSPHRLPGANEFVNFCLQKLKYAVCFRGEIPECVQCQMKWCSTRGVFILLRLLLLLRTMLPDYLGTQFLNPASVVVAPACSCFDFVGHTFHRLYLSLAFCFKARNKSYDVLRFASVVVLFEG